MTVTERGSECFPWIESRTGCVLTRDARMLVASRGESIVGALAFDGWTPAAVHIHMAVDEAIAWRSLRPALLDYVFQHAGKQLLIGVIPSSNRRSLRIAKRLGGVETYRVLDGWDLGTDLVVFEMRAAGERHSHVAMSACAGVAA